MEKKEKPNRQEEQGHDTGGSNAGGAARPALVVGIGAGAGSLKSLEKLLGNMPAGQGVALVLIHPEFTRQNLVELLRGRTALEAVEASEGMTVLADRVYVVPSDKFLNVAGDRFTLQTPVHCDGLLMPIDHFFCSLAADRRDRCCGVLLSGNGGDGTLGLSEIRAAGGRTFAEDPGSAEVPGMPRNAIDAGVTDDVLTAEAMAESVALLAKRIVAAAGPDRAVSPEFDADLRAVLDILRTRVGHDFRCYKPSTLVRRIHRRMALGGIETMEGYALHLAERPDEVSLLQKDLLIGVTDFFRKPSAWETLEKKVIAQFMENAPQGPDIRVWVPGCSTGKEVYSLAMLLAEQAGKAGGKANFQIFATDADAAALAKARTGIYPEEEISGNVSPERLNEFFSRKDGHYQVIKSIRERVVFAPQNITADPPFSRLDLIICRNLLIYLDQQVQRKIITLFHFALRDGGFLFLGNAETIGDREDLFEPVSKKWRIYRRIGVGHRVSAEIPVHPAGDAYPALLRPPAATAPRMSLTSMAQQVLLDRFTPACVMIDRKLQVLYVHGMVENYLTLPAGELTTRVVDMAREGLRARLRGAIGKCIETGRPVSFTARTRRGEKSVPVKVMVSSLRNIRETGGLLLITFEDQRFPAVKSSRQTAAEGDVQQLADELKITREELQSTIDQLESSNDQLKASNEEVMAANEELQSANEEMETSKEELQSLNEELNTINVRLQEKVDELESANNDVVNLLASTSIATLFLDKKFRIKRYTPAVNRLMSLIPSDVGRPLGDILLRVHDETLLTDARQVLVDLTPVAKEARAEDGRWYIRRIMPYRTQDDRIEGVVVTFVDVTDLKQAQEALDESRRRLSVILDSIADGFFAVDRQWRFTHINDAALLHFRKSRDEVLGRQLFEVFPAARGTVFETQYQHAMESGEAVHFETGSVLGDRTMELHAYPGRESLTVLFRDATERHRMVRELDEALRRTAWLARFPEDNPSPVVRAAADGNILYCNPASVEDSEWACRVGEALSEPLRLLVEQAFARGEEVLEDVRLGERVFTVSVTPFPEESYANVYGRDITKRKLAEESLRRSEARLRRAQDIAHLGSWELDLADNRLAWSDEVFRIFGLKPQEFAATYEAFLERIHPSDREAVNAAYLGSLRENRDTYEIEHRVIRKNTGEIRFVHERGQHFRDASGRIVRSVGMVHDITERKNAEETLRQSEERYRTLFDSLIEGFCIIEMVFDQAGRPVDYRFLEVNPAFEEQTGLHDAQGKLMRELVPEHEEHWFEIYGKIALTGEPARFVDEAKALNRWYEVCAFRMGGQESRKVAVCFSDITERKQAEEALRENEGRLQLFIEHAPAALAMFDREMRYLSVSRRWRSDYGLAERNLIGISHYAVFPEISAEWREAHRRGLAGEVLRAEADRFERAGGSTQWVHWEIHPWLDAAGAVGGIVIFSEDITERKQAEDALENRSKQLEAANKELESFSYTISHDLRAPLRAIDGYTRMILKKHGDQFDSDCHGKFNVIRDNARMMGQLIDDLLAFSRASRTELSLSNLDVEELIREIWKELRNAEPDRRLHLKIPELLPPAGGDPAMIRQVLFNLLANAVKFTRGRQEAQIVVEGRVMQGENVYSIKDNGVGFDMQYHDKMFGVFHRLHNEEEFEGTGVGLAIVQRIIQRHGGRIWAEGRVDEGATFHFTLPRKEDRAIQGEKQEIMP